MKNKLSALGYVGLGAALMYILDPDRGRQRRAALLSGFQQMGHKVTDALEHTLLRLAGAVHGAAHGLAEELPADEVLVQRVRSEIGHLVAHAQDLKVEARQGHVILSGRVRPYEIENVLRRTWSTKGVREVSNLLEVRPSE